MFLFFLLLPPLLPLFWPLPSALLFLASALMSTRSLLIRTRFLRSLCCCANFSSRSLRRSSLDFFLGRVLWLREERSILPNTLGSFEVYFFSLFNVNTLEGWLLSAAFCSAFCCWASTFLLPCAAFFWPLKSFIFGCCDFCWFSCFISCFWWDPWVDLWSCFGSLRWASFTGAWLTAAVSCFGASDFLAADSTDLPFPMLSKSILPNGLYCCWLLDSNKLSARWSFCSGARFLSLAFLVMSFSAWSRTSLSWLKASFNALYCWSLSLKLGSALTSPRSFLFSRNSTAVWSPIFNSRSALFNLMLIYIYYSPIFKFDSPVAPASKGELLFEFSS